MDLLDYGDWLLDESVHHKLNVCGLDVCLKLTIVGPKNECYSVSSLDHSSKWEGLSHMAMASRKYNCDSPPVVCRLPTCMRKQSKVCSTESPFSWIMEVVVRPEKDAKLGNPAEVDADDDATDNGDGDVDNNADVEDDA